MGYGFGAPPKPRKPAEPTPTPAKRKPGRPKGSKNRKPSNGQ